jgi:DNA-binding transcriptional regulator YiaG
MTRGYDTLFLMRTRSQFVTWLESRRSAGESLASIARGFGVSPVTVKLWLDGRRNPSRMALVLGGLLARGDAGAWPMV